MRNACIAVLLLVASGYAWTDISMPNTFVDSGIIYASDHNENDSTAAQGINDLADTVEIEFMRWSDLSSGDSTLYRVQVDTIRSNPDVDSLQGKPYIDSIITSYAEIPTIKAVDTIRGNPDVDSLSGLNVVRGNPDVDSISGYPFIDSVASGFFNVTKIFTDTIKSNPVIDSMQGLDVVRGNPDIDSISGSPTINAATVVGNLTLNNTTASRLLSTDGSKVAASTSINLWVSGTANQVTVGDDGDGTITLSTPQDIATTSSVTFDSVASTKGITGATVNTGQGNNELYAMNQDVQTGDAVTFTTVNTGQGANELYAMDQNVQTSDVVTFSAVNTGYGNNELYAMDQNVRTTDDVNFDSLDCNTGRIDNLQAKWVFKDNTHKSNADIADSSLTPETAVTTFDLSGVDTLCLINGVPNVSVGGYVAELTIVNVGDSLFILHNTLSNGSGYRIHCPEDVTYTLGYREAVTLTRYYTDQNWIIHK